MAKKTMAFIAAIIIFLSAAFFYINNTETVKMELKSTAFKANEKIPSEYTCDGDNFSPELVISNVPQGARSLVLIMDDPDIPDFVKQQRGIEVFDHWIAFNIPPETNLIPRASEPEGTQGKNGAGSLGYMGPCPPDREHRYFFKLYALDTTLDLDEGATKAEVEKAMEGHVLEKTELIGRYERISGR